MPYTRDVRVKDKLGDKSCGALSKDGEIHLITCNEPKAGYVCELRTGNVWVMTIQYSQPSRKQTPFGPSVVVRLQEVSAYEWLKNRKHHRG